MDEYNIDISHESTVFVLDIRGAKLDLHRLSVLVQFFHHLGEKYESLQVWTNDQTFLFSASKSYSKEAKDIVQLIEFSTKARFFEKSAKCKIESGYSYIQISNGSRNPQYIAKEIFQREAHCESLPIKYSYPINYECHPELESLKSNLNSTFNIAFSPTLDLNLRVEESSRKYGVISHDNFSKLEEVYLEIQNRILLEGIDDIKIVFLNKKMFNWNYFPNVVDLRHFEDYGLNFASVLYLIQECCEWTIGSEGTMQCYLMLSKGLKHAVYVDNSHWGYSASNGSTVPLFMEKIDYLSYKDAPNKYIPDGKEVVGKIFKDYYEFKESN